MAGPKMVKMTALSRLDDPFNDKTIEAGQEFETSEERALEYTRYQWATSPGDDASEILTNQALENYQAHKDARRKMQSARSTFRNAFNPTASNNVGASGILSAVVSTDPQGSQAPDEEGPKTESYGVSEPYGEYKVDELRAEAKSREIRGVSQMNRDDLEAALRKNDEEQASANSTEDQE